jgi:putative ABC transport system permease protein
MQTIRYAWRRLWSTPTVTSVAMFTMALGIAASTAVFSVADAVLFRPLPYATPDRLVMVWDRWIGWPATWISDAEFLDYQEKARSFSDVGVFTDMSRNLTGGTAPQRVHVGIVSAGIFPALGVQPTIGRVFGASEDRRGAPRVAVISDGLWKRRYASDSRIIGRSMLLDDSSTTIIGVMPPGFHLPLDFGGDPTDLWVPLALGTVDRTVRGGHYLNLVARLRQGSTLTSADAEVRAMGNQMVLDYPRGYPPDFGTSIRPLVSQVLGDVRPTVLVLVAAVVFVLLIACANVASLLLGRAHARQREMALRASLGASRRHIMQQLLTEALVLVAVSGCVAIVFAFLGLHVLAAAAPRDVPRIQDVAIDGPVLAFALVVTLVTGLACGLAPAIHATRADLHLALKEAGRGSASGRRNDGLRRTLVATEVALSLILLVGAGLLARSFARLRAVDPGFDSGSLLTARMALPASKYPDSRSVRAFYRSAVEKARALPGVTDAAAVRVLPFTAVMGDWSFRPDGVPMGQEKAAGDWQVVSPAYFAVMRIALKEGRTLNETDDERGPGAVVVNEALARRAWPGEQALGQHIRMGGPDSTLRTVVGVVANVRHRGLDADPRPEIYLPHSQWTVGGVAVREMYLVIRSSRDPRALAASVRQTVRSLDPDLPLTSVRTMDDVLGSWAAARRISFLVLAALAVTAAALAAVGLYGVVSYAVTQRTSEIGIRRALGASTHSVIALVAGQSARPVIAGIAVGLVGAFTLSRLMSAMLFHVSATDPVIFMTVPLLVLIVAALAVYFPARRATQVDPITAVRTD